jgi:hypothetical protein
VEGVPSQEINPFSKGELGRRHVDVQSDNGWVGRVMDNNNNNEQQRTTTTTTTSRGVEEN